MIGTGQPEHISTLVVASIGEVQEREIGVEMSCVFRRCSVGNFETLVRRITYIDIEQSQDLGLAERRRKL